MVNFAGAAGSEAVEKARKSAGGGRYTPSLYWKEVGDTKYIQFIGDEQQFYTFQTFNMMTVGTRDNGNPMYESFISQRDANVGDAESTDLITERYGIKPKARTFAIAVELEAQVEQTTNARGKTVNSIAGFTPLMRKYKDKDDVEHEVPTVGIINESPFIETFFPWITDYAQDHDISAEVFKITKKDKGKDTRYYIESVGEGLDLAEIGVEDEVEKLHEELSRLADPARQVEIISALPDDFILDKWQQQKGKAAPAKTSRAAKPVEAEETPEGEEEVVPRSEQFAALRGRFATK